MIIDRILTYHLKLPLAALLHRVGLTANQMNLFGVILALVAGLLGHLGHFSIAALTFLFASFFDLIDGSVAKVEGTYYTNHLGAWQDAAGGFVSEYLSSLPRCCFRPSSQTHCLSRLGYTLQPLR